MSLEKIINDAWENKDQVDHNSDKSLKDAINQIINDFSLISSLNAPNINWNIPVTKGFRNSKKFGHRPS